jgi:hypothetical protein
MTDSSYSNSSATMADINLQQIHDDLVSIALKAGQMILSATPSLTSLETKKSSNSTKATLYHLTISAN